MSELLCITNRKLCAGDFLERLEQVVSAPNKVSSIVLREKDLPVNEYAELLLAVMDICRRHGVALTVHSHAELALQYGLGLHLPLAVLREMEASRRLKLSALPALGVSCHSVADAQEAEGLGCTYVTAGHIWATDCKAGLPGRGTEFLRQVCQAVKVPVYAIGGITPPRMAEVVACGATGACIMSSLMKCYSPAELLQEFDI